jgi:hypothetical protein
MAGRASLSAHQRFVVRSRMRANRRARRMRLLGAMLMPFALLSCVANDNLSRATGMMPQAPSALSFAGIPVIAGTPVPVDRAAPQTLSATPTGPSFVSALDQRDRMRATLCLASAIYYEAATEPDEGQRAVAQVVLNRVLHPQWPHTVCGVVYQGSIAPGCQFSFACDGAIARAPMLSAWIRARRVAERALAGEVYLPVGSATFYHTIHVAPAWGRRMTPVAIVGAHIFYRLPGDSPDAAALPMLYAGGEPTPGPLPRVAPPAQLMQVVMRVAGAQLPAAPDATPPTAPRETYSLTPPSRDSRYVAGALPDSSIREEYRDSGQWIAR